MVKARGGWRRFWGSGLANSSFGSRLSALGLNGELTSCLLHNNRGGMLAGQFRHKCRGVR